jgi:hypothetical protein
MTRTILTLAAASICAGLAAADPPRKEPAYQSKSPLYAQLAFGPEGKDRVWLVLDGDALYADTNGDGDLTEPGEKFAPAKPPDGHESTTSERRFEVGDVRLGGRHHRRVQVTTLLLAQFPSYAADPGARALLQRRPDARLFLLSADVDSAPFRGGAGGGRTTWVAGPRDPEGFLQFADRPVDAPLVHFGGPLAVTFYGSRPTLRIGREQDVVLVVGTAGCGPGTFAEMSYEETIPESVRPRVEVVFPGSGPDAPPVKELFELKERC